MDLLVHEWNCTFGNYIQSFPVKRWVNVETRWRFTEHKMAGEPLWGRRCDPAGSACLCAVPIVAAGGPRCWAFLTLSLCNCLTCPLGYYGFLWQKYSCVWNSTLSRNSKFSPLVNLQPSRPVQCPSVLCMLLVWAGWEIEIGQSSACVSYLLYSQCLIDVINDTSLTDKFIGYWNSSKERKGLGKSIKSRILWCKCE